MVDCCEAFPLLLNLKNIGKGGPSVREWCRRVLREQGYGDGGSYKSWSFWSVGLNELRDEVKACQGQKRKTEKRNHWPKILKFLKCIYFSVFAFVWLFCFGTGFLFVIQAGLEHLIFLSRSLAGITERGCLNWLYSVILQWGNPSPHKMECIPVTWAETKKGDSWWGHPGKLNNKSTLVGWELASSGHLSVEGLRQGQLIIRSIKLTLWEMVSGHFISFVSAWWYGTLVLLWGIHQSRLLRHGFKPIGSLH